MISFRFLLCVLFLSLFTSRGQDMRLIEYLEAKEIYKDFISTHSNFHQTKHHSLHYLKWGKDTDPAILWLHGSYSNAIEIEPFASDLLNANFQVLSVDYYGHGLTQALHHQHSLETLLDGISSLLNDLKIDKVIIGGFSRGGYIASSFYDKYPDKVKGLLLEDGGVSPFLSFLQTKNEEELKSFATEDLSLRPKALFEMYDTEIDAYYAIREFSDTSRSQLFKNLFFIRQHQNKYKIYSGQDTIYGMESYQSLKKLMQAELYANPFANDLMLKDYYSIINNSKIPVLLMEACSQDDQFDDVLYYQNLDNKKLIHKRFYKSSHHIKYEEPIAFTEAIQSFLKTIF